MPAKPDPSVEDEGWEEHGGVSAHAWRSQAQADAVQEKVGPYLDKHRLAMAGRWLDWDGDDATFVVAFTEDVDRHRAALEPLGARVVFRRHPESQLEAIAEELFAVAEEVNGVVALATWADPIQGKAFVEAVTQEPDRLRAELAAKYGELAELVWLGPDESVSRTVAFDAYVIDDDDRTLTVGWNGGAPEPEPLVIEESSDSIVVTASELTPVGAVPAYGMRRTATARLELPLAGRSVIDASTGRAIARGHVAHWHEQGTEFTERNEPVLQDAIDLVTKGADADALKLFAELAASRPEVFDDPVVARKRRLAELRLKRTAGP